MSPPANAVPPKCPKCRQPMLRVGELPQLDEKLPLDIYKCFACREVALIKPAK